ncbi:MAG: hypothetical protein WCY15_02695 [Phenylobacterium sp.]|jgi:hypothetical protein|uniref:hypothetical protein n=1 Tax=Phenylobacterium sp. TaxID=1871053 RepID=UPI002A3599C3|nr:hypothetical protein [Phenylobacterium sp.]MDX9997136.1 hypothetical protein [Phenylobacterium sp.]
MNQFSPSEAALEGFRLVRRHPGAILAWCGVYFLGIVAIALVMAAVLGPTFIAFIGEREIQPADYDRFAGELIQYWPSIIAVLMLALYFIAVITNAMFRTMQVRGPMPRAGIRFGGDEIRVAIVHSVLSFLFLCILASMGWLMAAAFQLNGVMALVSMGLVALFVWLFVRLGLALPATLAEGRVAFAKGWRLSRGRFWSLLGMWTLAIIFYFMTWLLITVVNGGFVALAAFAQSKATGTALGVLVVAVAIVAMLIQMFSSVLQIVIPLAPTGVAYEALGGPEDEIPAVPPAGAEPTPA